MYFDDSLQSILVNKLSSTTTPGVLYYNIRLHSLPQVFHINRPNVAEAFGASQNGSRIDHRQIQAAGLCIISHVVDRHRQLPASFYFVPGKLESVRANLFA